MTAPPHPADERDLHFLRRAIALAGEARSAGKHPFGALVVVDGEVTAEAGNHSLPPDGDPTQHAELRVAALAARRRSPGELRGATRYTSAEPCCMCAGAVHWCGIGRVVYALSEVRRLELTGDHPENPTLALPCREVFARGQRPIAVIGPHWGTRLPRFTGTSGTGTDGRSSSPHHRCPGTVAGLQNTGEAVHSRTGGGKGALCTEVGCSPR